jgi:hypothetical protein
MARLGRWIWQDWAADIAHLFDGPKAMDMSPEGYGSSKHPQRRARKDNSKTHLFPIKRLRQGMMGYSGL